MSKLVIAEKPMLARDIARAITGKEVSESARLPISGNGYTVCACAGHLLELVKPDTIDPKWGMPWSLDVLPIEVHDWPKEPAVDKKTGESKKPLIDQIAGLLKTCDSVIAAGDPDDEGQLIVDELLDYLGYAGKVERVYVNDNIEKNIVKAFDKLVPNDSCRGAGNAAYARQMADMCFGVNETRLATKRLDGLFTVGRVQTPTLGLVVKRDEAIAHHVTRKFYELFASGDSDAGELTFKYLPGKELLAGEKHLFERHTLEALKEKLDGRDLHFETTVSKKQENPPLPYNLTVLLSDMSERFGFTAAQTQQITQDLRDKYKAITYNRSDSQYLKVTKKQLLDADGNPVTAETEFVPEDTYGTVDVTFTFDGSLLKDNTPVVAFESLSYKDKEIASHSDIEDEDQTVTMHTSEIGTTATDKLDGDKTVIADAESTVTDKVEYDHVLTGKAYTMAGILMDAKTGLPVLTGEGAKKYTEDDLTKFTSGLMNVLGFQSNTYSIKVKDKDWGNGAAIVKNADGSYTYDASERTENEDGTWTVKTDTQTLTEQEDGTWKLTGLEGSGSATADGGTSFVRNIEETYKADEVEVTDNGIDWSNAKKLPTASIDLAKVKAYAEENKDLLSCLVYKTAEFTPEKESGSIDMDYTFNSNDVIDRLSGETKNLVVFEVMFKGSIENASDETPVSIVASECDKDNEGQTVKLAPSTIGTTATDKSDGDHELMAGKDAVITDEVKYEGLIPGKEYTLHATLMDKKTGEPLKVADKGVTAELKFTPNSESGTVSINLGEFDATSLDGHTLVVFEELTKQSDIDGKATDVTVAEHKDINDEGQSVTVTSTPAGSTYGKTGVDMTNIAIAIGILLIAAGCATAYGIKSRNPPSRSVPGTLRESSPQTSSSLKTSVPSAPPSTSWSTSTTLSTDATRQGNRW